MSRVTLTVPAINRARHVVLLVTSARKAATVQAVLEGPRDRYPAQRIAPESGCLTWLLDREAAQDLEGTRWRWGQ
jgi:6-phosphogluconolactonase